LPDLHLGAAFLPPAAAGGGGGSVRPSSDPGQFPSTAAAAATGGGLHGVAAAGPVEVSTIGPYAKAVSAHCSVLARQGLRQQDSSS
jgi:hypothetical protein